MHYFTHRAENTNIVPRDCWLSVMLILILYYYYCVLWIIHSISEHVIIIYGSVLLPNRKWEMDHYNVIVESKSGSLASKDFHKTRTLPRYVGASESDRTFR